MRRRKRITRKEAIRLAGRLALLLAGLWLAACVGHGAPNSTPTEAAPAAYPVPSQPAPTATPGVGSSPAPSEFNSCGEQRAPSSAATPAAVTVGPETAPGDSASLSVGQVLEVRLGYFIRWSWTLQGDTNVLVPMEYGVSWFEAKPPVCAWRFRGHIPGTVTLAFSGSPNCPPGSLCPYFVAKANFQVTVKAQ